MVAADDQFFSVLLMYEIHCADAGFRFLGVFRQRADAARWLEVMPTRGIFTDRQRARVHSSRCRRM
jgi:hypothetical protein